IEVLKNEMLSTEKGYLEKTWEDISSSKENTKVLLSVAEFGSGIYAKMERENVNVYRGLSNLINKGIIVKLNNNSYKLSDPLFDLWLQRNIIR
ncbi:MAG: hypothetical protein KAT15_10315, partial [Bacteroidales bacterium]|nr:hypothetical protein [Bacteroidales bacterium]